MAGRRTRSSGGGSAAAAVAAAPGGKKAAVVKKEEPEPELEEEEEEVVVAGKGGKGGKAAGNGNKKRKVAPVAAKGKGKGKGKGKVKEVEEEEEEEEEEDESSEESEDDVSSSDEEEGDKKDVVKAQAQYKGVDGGAEGLSEFERERLENIRRNKEYLQALGLGDTRAEIGLAATAARAKAPKPKRVSKGLKPAKREPREPTRKSRRLEGQAAPHYNEEKLIMEVEAQAEKEQRMDEGPLTLETLNRTEEGGEAFLGLLKELLAEREGKGEGTASASSASAAADMDYAARLAALTLDEEKDIAKLTPSRVTAMAVHPSERNLVVVAADVDGYFGVWQVDAPPNDETGGVYKFRPHISKVASLQYHPHDPAQLLSASHDGTLRCLDLTKQVFDLLLATGDNNHFEDSGFTCAHLAPHSPHNLYLAGHESSTGMLDLRTRKLAWVNPDAHAKKVNSIEAHPTMEHLFVSSSTDRVVRLWDARKPKKEMWGIAHTNSINNATFNPTGSHMLVTCQDHNLYLHADPTNAKEPTVKDAQYRIRHNNNTGRWLSKFWPMWDPKHPDAFVIGSLEQPRRIEVYSAAAGFQIASVRSDYMNSVQSICVFHPTRNILVGANSSGRTHVFRGP